MFELHYILYLILIASGFLVGSINHGKRKEKLPVIILLGITFFCEFIARILACTIKNNAVVYHLFHPIQATLWGVFFYMNMQTNMRKYIVPVWACLMLFGIINLLFLQNIKDSPYNFVKFDSVILLFWSFCLFFELLDRPTSENIFANGTFIICVAVMWFNLVSYLFFALLHLSTMWRSDTAFSLKGIHYFSNYTFYTLLLFSMFIKNVSEYE